MGPGLGRDAKTESLVREALDHFHGPLVLDADALDDRAYGGTAPRILTPHPGEMARLTGKPTAEIQKDRIGAARAICHGARLHAGIEGTTHTAGLPRWPRVDQPDRHARDGHRRLRRRAHGADRGLSGAVSQSADEAVGAAVYLHGLAGQLAARKLGEKPLIATDILQFLPRALESATEACAGVPDAL